MSHRRLEFVQEVISTAKAAAQDRHGTTDLNFCVGCFDWYPLDGMETYEDGTPYACKECVAELERRQASK